MISTLQKLAGIGSTITDSRASTINFNANLPITIEVLKQLDRDRFKLKLGRKELTTKSQKNLKEGKRYWGNFFEGKGGILTISNLTLQPYIFQSDAHFLDISLEPMMKNSFSFEEWKAFLIQNLLDEHTSKETFATLSHMLVALSKHTIHLPLLREGKKYLLQFKNSSNPDQLRFYAGFENLGPIQGTITQHNGLLEMEIEVLYDKSLFFLQKESHKFDMITHISIAKDILPLYDLNDLLLDLKG